MEQARHFEQLIGPISCVVVLQCPEAVLLERLRPRGRFDDGAGNIRRRLDTWGSTTARVIDHFGRADKVRVVDAQGPVPDVYERLARVVRGFAGRRVVASPPAE